MMATLRTLAAVVLMAVAASAQGTYTSPDGNFILEYTPIGDPATEVAFKMTAQTTGWVSLCVNNPQTHIDADCYVGYVDATAGATMQDSYMATMADGVVADTVINISPGSVTGLESGTTTELSWSRLLDTGDATQDKVITNADLRYTWALGAADVYANDGTGHVSRGSMTLNVLAPPVVVTPTPTPIGATPTPTPTPVPPPVVDTHVRGSHKFDDGAFDLSWAIEKPIGPDSVIEFTMSAKTQGVISLGLGTNHNGMDVYQGMVIDGVAQMRDATVTGYAVPSDDGVSSIIKFTGGEMAGLTYLAWSRRLLTGDATGDMDILDAPMTVQYAYSVTDQYAEQHSEVTRGSTILNFVTPSNVGAGPQGGGGGATSGGSTAVDWASLPLTQGRYANTDESFTLAWACVNAQCTFTMSATTTGWVALALGDPHKQMDTYMGNVVNGAVTVVDGMSVSEGVVPTEETQNIVPGATGVEAGGALTMIEFSRAFDTQDSKDLVITPGKTMQMSWAYGTTDDMTTKHSKKGTMELLLVEDPAATTGGDGPTGPLCGNGVMLDAKQAAVGSSSSMSGFFPTSWTQTDPVRVPVGSTAASPTLKYGLPAELLMPGTYNVWLEIMIPTPELEEAPGGIPTNVTDTPPPPEPVPFTAQWTGGALQRLEIPAGVGVGTKTWIMASAAEVGGVRTPMQVPMSNVAWDMTFKFDREVALKTKIEISKWYIGSATTADDLGGLISTYTDCAPDVQKYAPPTNIKGAWINDKSDFKMDWTINRDSIEVTMRAQTRGWIAFALGPPHQAMDVWGGSYAGGIATIIDGYSTTQGAPVADTVKNLDVGSSAELLDADDIVTVKIKRKLVTGDPQDVPITMDSMQVSWAMSDETYLTTPVGKHNAYGQMNINFFDSVAHSSIGKVGPVPDSEVKFPAPPGEEGSTEIVAVGGGNAANSGTTTTPSDEDEDDSMMVGGVHVGIIIGISVLFCCLVAGFVKHRINKCQELEAGYAFQEQCRAIHASSPGAMGHSGSSYRQSNSHVLV